MSRDILIVDDEADICSLVAGILEDEGYETRMAVNSDEAFAAIRGRQPNLILLDIWLQDSELDGLQMLDIILKENPEQQIVMISGHATLDMAVKAIKSGAHDFLTKPFKSEVLLHTVARAIEEHRLREENTGLLKVSEAARNALFGSSLAVEALRGMIDATGPTESRVLIAGPKGVGKSLVARLLHEKSRRSAERLIILNCAGMSLKEAEQELFGVEPVNGAPRKAGVLEQAHGSTALLTTVEELPLAVQGRLARVLHRGAFQRLGADSDADEVSVNVRVLATTARTLEDEVAAKRFSEDLFHRLNVVTVNIPPLVERREDVPELLAEIMAHSAMKLGRQLRPFTPQAIIALQGHDWPGNVRELSNVVDRILLAVPPGHCEKVTKNEAVEALGRVTEQEETRERNLSGAFTVETLREARARFEKEYLSLHLERFGGNVRKTAGFVGMDKAALHRKLKSLGLAGTNGASSASVASSGNAEDQDQEKQDQANGPPQRNKRMQESVR